MPYPVAAVRGQNSLIPISTLISGLVAYWKLDESSNGSGAVTRNDSVGANNLTDIGTTESAIGIVGNCASFVPADGTKLQRNSTSDLQMGDIDFTFAFWIYPNTQLTSGKQLINKSLAGSPFTTEYLISANTASKIVINFGAAYQPTLTITTGAWNLVIAYHDSVNNLFGLQINNGVPQTTSSAGAFPSPAAGPFSIGGRAADTTTTPDAKIDAVGIWKRLLTTAEKSALYNSGGGIQYPF